MRVAFFCMESVFSVAPLEGLLRAGHDVVLVVRPMGDVNTRKLPSLKRHRGFDVAVRRLLGVQRADAQQTDPLAIAARESIPAYLVGDASQPRVVQLLKDAAVDVIVVAFFNQLLSPALLSAARLGGVNLHPSLLPLHRGPAPLFWTFKNGDAQTGLTVHRLSAGEDAGDIVCQRSIDVAFGTPGEQLVDALAQHAGSDIVRALALLGGAQAAAPQDPARATRAPRPIAADLLVTSSMSARRAFHFVRGVGRWNDVRVTVGARAVRVVDALDCDEGRVMPGDCALVGDLLHLGCVDGVVTFRSQLHV